MATVPDLAALAEQYQNYLALIQARDEQIRNWLSGTASGGPSSNGIYPVTVGGADLLLPSPARTAQLATKLPHITLNGPGPHVLNDGQAGQMLHIYNGASNATLDVHLHANAAAETVIMVHQEAGAKLRFLPQGAATLRNFSGHNQTAGLDAVATLMCIRNTGTAAVWLLVGDTAPA